jgi:type I restriction enzyme, R subunit
MNKISFKEDHISQLPALQLLISMGYTYLTPMQADELRGQKSSHVVLEEVLRKQLKQLNSIQLGINRTTYFSDENIEKGIQALKNLPLQEGLGVASEKVYNLLTLGHTLEQSIDGDKKSFTLNFIDWQEPNNNVFHVTEEFSVLRTGQREHYRPDVVLFVNGIPLVVIECKRPDMREPLQEAISQHLRNQQEDGIRPLYVYSQLLLAISSNQAMYATTGTKPKFWAHWKERSLFDASEADTMEQLDTLKNTPLEKEEVRRLFEERFWQVRKYFDQQHQNILAVTEQDRYLYSLCRPDRLLDLAHNFILFESGEKKVARYQQFFAIKKAMRRITHPEPGQKRGGVIWHTQGSGKSLTMLLLAQAIALEPSIKNPKIILVTDRSDLDAQITGTFRKCGMPVENATSGKRLVELLQSKSDAVITTIINKFEAAINKMDPLPSENIFVLIDEGHRTQHGIFNISMQKALPHASFIAMTGTPLFKKEKNTAAKFGGIIDTYTLEDALPDKAVVPLLYEGRLAPQEVNSSPIDKYFNLISEPFNEQQKADMKRKFSRYDHLNAAEQKMYRIAWDISQHFRDNFQGTPFKGQLVCDKKLNAIRFKEFLDDIKMVSSEVLISGIDDREGEDSAYYKSEKKEHVFWDKMMQEHGNAKNYERNIISRFKGQRDPEIIIVVDKLLTGFDEPKNTVLYLTRNLQGHKLLQAIARVNRVYPDKDHGYIVDYYGVIQQLDDALRTYSSLSAFEEEDVNDSFFEIQTEIKKLPQYHSAVWDIFNGIRNANDPEAYQQLLRDEALRVQFYDRLASYAKCLKTALSSLKFHEQTNPLALDNYKEDLAMFMRLRQAVISRYSDKVDYSQYEGQIQKLIDTHIVTDEIQVIIPLVDIFDKDKFAQEVARAYGTEAKADMIASRTAKHITQKMEEDPAFYKKFSQLLSEVIADYEAKRLSETEYLNRTKDLMGKVLSRTDSSIPVSLQSRDVARAFFGLSVEWLKGKINDAVAVTRISEEVAICIDDIVRGHVFDNGKPKVDWQAKTNITGRLFIELGDYFIDEVNDKYNLELSFDEMDHMSEQFLNVAKRWYL